MSALTPAETVGVELARLVCDVFDMIADGRAQFAILPVEGGDESTAQISQGVLLDALDDRARALVNVGDAQAGAATGLAVKHAVDAVAHDILLAHKEIPLSTLLSSVAIAAWRSARGYGGKSVPLGDLTWGYTLAVAEIIADLPPELQPAATFSVGRELPKAVESAIADRLVIRAKPKPGPIILTDRK